MLLLRRILKRHSSRLSPIWLLLLFATACTNPLTDADHLARAKEFREKGDLHATTIELKNALRKNPKNIEARRLLGEIHLKLGNGAAAEKELRRALELGLAKEAVLLSLAESLQVQGKHQAILDEIDPAPTLPPRDQATLAAYRGDAWLALGKTDKARDEYRRALETDPESPRAKLGLAYLAAAEEDLERALALVDEALKTAPGNGLLWRYKAELHRRRGELEQAETAYTKAIEHLPLKALARAERALVRIELKKLDLAATDIEILRKTAPKFHLTHFADGYLKFAQKRFREAKEALEKALALDEHYPFTHFYLGLTHLQLGELEQADTRLSRFKAMLPGLIQAHQALALVKYREKHYDTARSLLRPVLLSRPDDPFTLNLMANIELASDHPKEGLKYLQKLAEQQPNSPQIQTRIGMALLIAGLKQEGITALERVRDEHPELEQPDILLARFYLGDRQFAKAKKTIDRLKKKMPDHPLPYDLEAAWHMAQGDLGQAEEALRRALKIAPNDPRVATNLARLLIIQHRLAEAGRTIENAIEAHPKRASLQLQLAKLELAQGKFQSAEARLSNLLQSSPNLLEPRLLLAKYYLQSGQPQRAQTILETARQRHPDHPALLSLLAKAQIASKLSHAALDTAGRLTHVDPTSPLGYFLLAQAQLQLGQFQEFRRALRNSLDRDPNFLPAKQAWIRLLAAEGKIEETERQLTELAKRYPNDIQVLHLRAWWALQRHRSERAINLYQEALKYHPNSSKTVRLLAKAVWQTGRRQQAIQLLDQWRVKHPKDTDTLYLLSLMYQKTGRKEDARKTLTEIVHTTPDHVLALNDLAWILRQSSPSQALKYAEKAYAAAPQAAWIIDTLGVVLLENGMKARALRTLGEAAQRAPNNPAILYHLAIAQHRNGLDEEAIASLKRALGSRQNFSERPDAQSLLDRLTSP